jgi:lipopolysaccharide export system permease protein
MGKEVIINDPNYASDVARLERISEEVTQYSHEHNLKSPPNIIKVFFKYQPDHEIERISEELEEVIEDLSNTRDRIILGLLGQYPVVSEKAHTRPFEHRWLNSLAAILVPVGAFLYIRMWTFRLRLLKDLRTIKNTNRKVTARIKEKGLADTPSDTLLI